MYRVFYANKISTESMDIETVGGMPKVNFSDFRTEDDAFEWSNKLSQDSNKILLYVYEDILGLTVFRNPYMKKELLDYIEKTLINSGNVESEYITANNYDK